MRLVNYTPWPHLVFERRDTNDLPLGVIVLQGTFALEDGKPLRALPDQEPVRIGDVYRGDPKLTSLASAGANATLKPRSDIHVDAIARAPGGRPRAEWPVRVRVGDVRKDVLVRGPHVWTHGPMLGWTRSAPLACVEVPLHYELAFGGCFDLPGGERVEERRNPVGTGLLPRGVDTSRPIRAPQIVALDEPDHVPGRHYVPQGVGPIPPHFAPRRDRIGTCDERWLRTKWPRVPEDFDYAHYQSAHPDLVYPGYLRGDEPIELVGLDAEGGTISAALPGWSCWILYRLPGRALSTATARLDTVHFAIAPEDPTLHRVYLTWRCLFRADLPIRGIEARMTRVGEEQLRRSA